MIPSDVNVAVITATPSTDQTKSEIKIEPAYGHNFNVTTQSVNFVLIYFHAFLHYNRY